MSNHASPGHPARPTVDDWFDRVTGSNPDHAAELLHPDAEFVEHPNLVSPNGSHRDRATMVAGLHAGAGLLTDQAFDDRDYFAIDEQRVLVTSKWRGRLAVDLGPWPAGTLLTADTAALVDVIDGLIRRQENWDCYDPVTVP